MFQQSHARGQAETTDLQADQLDIDEGDAQPLATGGQALGIAIGQQHHELFSAIACQDIAVAQAGRGHAGKRLQHLIASRMAVNIVDAFEVIEVDQRQAMHHAGVPWL